MRRLGLLLGIAALALLVVACAGRPPVSAGAPPTVTTAPTTAPSSTAPTTASGSTARPAMPVHLPAGAEPVAGSKVDASALPAGYSRLVWTQDNGSVIGFLAQEGACSTESASVATQTDDAVTVRLVLIQPASVKPCPLNALNKVMTVNLDRPLGDRTVIMQAAIERG